MNANEIYSHLRAGQLRAAFASSQQWWRALRWEVRSIIVGAALGLLLIWVFATMSWLAGLLALPLVVGAWIAVARPAPVPQGVANFALRAEGRRERAAAKGTFFAKWIWRPFQASLSGAAKLTAGLQDPYQRAGATVALQMYAVCLALALAYITVYAVLVLLCIAVSIWVLAYMFADQRGGGGSRLVSRAISDSVSRRMAARSEQREDFLGNPYTQHYDDQGNPIGRTETREDFLGNQYQQHISAEGDNIGRSEEREGFFGNRYVQHLDAQSDAAGHSEEREGLFGDKYTQHFDAEGNPTGRSETREDFFGKKYVKHDED